MRGQLAPPWASAWNRVRQTASKSMRDVAALAFALGGCASICAAAGAAGMASTVCREQSCFSQVTADAHTNQH